MCVCFLFTLPRAAPPVLPCHDAGILGAGPGRVAVCGEADSGPVTGSIRRLFGLPIDINDADAETLTSLPGIGPSRAQAIVDGRPYVTVSDLMRVPGVGAKRLAKIRHLIAAKSRLAEEAIASP
jgi:competence ComEA-like helix-hairpin-helix protein